MSVSALLLIDVQKGFSDSYWGIRNNPEAEKNMAKLLDHWRETKLPVIHVKHHSSNPDSPLHPAKPGADYQDFARPHNDEPEFVKNVNSGFIGTDLKSYLDEQQLSSLTIIGLTTDHCVSTTTRMAGNFGFEVTLVADATATFGKQSWDGKRHYSAEEIHQIQLSSLHGEFCEVVTTADLLTR